MAGSLTVASLNAAAGALGAWAWYGRLTTERPVGAFWVLLRAGQGSALMLAIAVGSLAVAGREASEGLFYLYALLPLAIAFVAEQLRVSTAQAILDERGLPNAQAVGALPAREQHELVAEVMRREIGVMATSALVVVFLALRAAGTAHGF